MPGTSIIKDKWPEMNWHVTDKVKASREFYYRLEIIFVANGQHKETHCAHILVAVGMKTGSTGRQRRVSVLRGTL